MNKHTHLNLDARILIETLLNEQHSFKSIARHLGKDCTTISKEVKAHICFEKIRRFTAVLSTTAVWLSCISVPCRRFASTVPTRITNRVGPAAGVLPPVISYEKYICPKLSKPPYVCNGCPQRSRCSLEKQSL